MNKFFVSSLLFALFALPAFSAASDDFVRMFVDGVVPTGGNITMTGSVLNASNTSQGFTSVNVSAVINGTNVSTLTTSGGAFTFNVTAPSTRGFYNVSMTDGNVTKNVSIFVSNTTSCSFDFPFAKPPYAAGETFTVNATPRNSTGDSMNSSYTFDADLFTSNGQAQNWSTYNDTTNTTFNGVKSFNFTVPTNAFTGSYAIVGDHGACYTSIQVRSNYVMALETQTTLGTSQTDFAPNGNITLIAKLRDLDGDPVTGNAVTVRIVLANGSVVNTTLSERNSTAYPGQYWVNITANSSGSMGFTAEANVSGSIVTSDTSSTIQNLRLDVVLPTTMFQSWGSDTAIAPGSTVNFNLPVFNLSTDALVTASTNGSASAINCSSTTAMLYNASNSSLHAIGTVTKLTGLYSGSTVCAVSFTAPSVAGTYKLSVVAHLLNSSSGTNATADEFFITQSYLLNAAPISTYGGGYDTFMTNVYPGESATFSVTAFNLSTGQPVTDGTLITSLSLVSVTPFDFKLGANASLTIQNSTSLGANPTLAITASNNTGFFEMKIRATLGGETVEGRAFFLTKYLFGFASPFTGGYGGGEGGQNFEGGMPASSCNGIQSFRLSAYDARTNLAASSVSVNKTLKVVRDELTGNDLSNCVTSTNGVTDSSGNADVNVTFTQNSSCRFSGFTFMLFNVTYKGNTDEIPGNVLCQNYKSQSQLQQAGVQGMSFQLGPKATLTLSVTNAKNATSGSALNGSINLTSFTVFDMSQGGLSYSKNTSINLNALMSNGTGSLNFSPSNFTDPKTGAVLTKWPNGFVNFNPQLCSNSGVCDTLFVGGQVVSFNAYKDYSGGGNFGQENVIEGYNATLMVNAQTNVSSVGNFTVKVGDPWLGSQKSATVVNATKLSDGWSTDADNSNYSAFERWNVTYVVPAGLKTGGQSVTVTVNNTLSETVDLWDYLYSAGSTITMLAEESFQIIDFQGGQQVGFDGTVNTTNGRITSFLPNGTSSTDLSWNTTIVNRTYNVSSVSGRVCGRSGLTITRWQQGGQTATYANSSYNFLVVDNTTAGTYNFVVINYTVGTPVGNTTNDTGRISVVAPSGSLSAVNSTEAIYLWAIKECNYLALVNANVTPNTNQKFAGSQAAGTNFTLPFKITKANAVLNVSMNVSSVIKQSNFQGNRGGFEEAYTVNTDYAYPIAGSTDSVGVVFLPVNISRPGTVQIMWKITNRTTGTLIESSDFNSGISADVRKYDTQGTFINFFQVLNFTANTTYSNASTLPVYLSNVTNMSTLPAYFNSARGWSFPSGYLYFGLINGSTLGFAPGFDYWLIDDDSNLLYQNNTDDIGNGSLLVESRAPLSERNGDVMFMNGSGMFDQVRIGTNRSVGGNYWLTAYIHANTPNNNDISLPIAHPNAQYNTMEGVNLTVDTNVTVEVCVYSFSRPRIGVSDARVQLFTRKYDTWPFTVINLTMYDPINQSSINGSAGGYVSTGSSGCVAFNASHGNSTFHGQSMAGWTSGYAGNQIEAAISYPANVSNSTDNAWLGRVMVQCPLSYC